MHEAIMVSAALGICLVSTIWNWKNIKKEKEFIKELKTVSTAYDFIKKGNTFKLCNCHRPWSQRLSCGQSGQAYRKS